MDIIRTLSHYQLDEIKRGFAYDTDNRSYSCIFCGMTYSDGIIYPVENQLYTAEKAALEHIKQTHDSVLETLLALPKKENGLSAIQQKILTSMREGLSDKETAKQNNIAESTVRNHRFVLREKYKEAKIFIAIHDLINNKTKENKTSTANNQFISFHATLPVDDDRIIITKKERDEFIQKYFKDSEQLLLEKFPKKQKEKLVILQKINSCFDKEKKYSESQINEILETIYPDYVTIRRYLIDYNFLSRKSDGTEYSVSL